MDFHILKSFSRTSNTLYKPLLVIEVLMKAL